MKFANLALVAIVAAKHTDKDFDAGKVQSVAWNYTKPEKNYTSSGYMVKPNDDQVVVEMRKTFKDYFYYAFKAKGLSQDDMEGITTDCSTDQECDNSGKMQACCMQVTMFHRATDTRDVKYKCMTKSKITANVDITMENYTYKMRCQSGAATLAATVVGTAAVLASLY